MWSTEQALKDGQSAAFKEALLFIFCSANLFISLILTITTKPGLIPEDREWDMPDASVDDIQLRGPVAMGTLPADPGANGAPLLPGCNNQMITPLTDQSARISGIEGPRGTYQSNVSDMIRMQNIASESHRQNDDSE